MSVHSNGTPKGAVRMYVFQPVEGYASSASDTSDTFEVRIPERFVSLRRVLVCSHITDSLEFANAFLAPQHLHTPSLSRPFGDSMRQ